MLEARPKKLRNPSTPVALVKLALHYVLQDTDVGAAKS